MEFDDKIPIYYQIKQYLYQEIITDRLKSGDQLPAVRQLAADLTVNVNTVQRALTELIQELDRLYHQLSELNLSDEEMKDAFAAYVDEQEVKHDN